MVAKPNLDRQLWILAISPILCQCGGQCLLQLLEGPGPRKRWRPLKTVQPFGSPKLRVLTLIAHLNSKTLKTEHIG